MISANNCNILEPPDSKPEYESINEIHMITSDGTNEELIAKGWNSEVMKTKNKILFSNNYSLYTVNYNGLNLKRIKKFTQGLWQFALSGKDDKIALSLYSNGSANLYLIDSDGNNLKRLTNDNNSFDIDPSFSSDMKMIVFRRNWNICILDLSNLEIQSLTDRTDSIYYRAPRFISHDSYVIYFEQGYNLDDSLSIHLYDLNNRIDKIILKLKGAVFNKFFMDISQDNKVIFIENYKLAEDSIKILDISNNSVTNFAAGHYASFSNDGKKIVYSDGNQIFLTDVKRTTERLIYKEQNNKKWIYNLHLSLKDNEIIFEKSYSVLKP